MADVKGPLESQSEAGTSSIGPWTPVRVNVKIREQVLVLLSRVGSSQLTAVISCWTSLKSVGSRITAKNRIFHRMITCNGPFLVERGRKTPKIYLFFKNSAALCVIFQSPA